MSLVSYGFVSIGDAVPLFLPVVGLTLPELTGKLAGLLSVSASLTVSPPSLAANLAAIAKVGAALALAIDGPTVTLQIGAIAAMIAEIQASIGLIEGYMALAATAGIAAYSYDGPVSRLGLELAGATGLGLPGGLPSDSCHAVVLVATNSAAISALSSFFIG